MLRQRTSVNCALVMLTACVALCQDSLAILAQGTGTWTLPPAYETKGDIAATALSIEDESHLQHVFYNESYAILIIEGVYSNPAWTSVPDQAQKNEDLLRKTLETHGFHVVIWRNLTGFQMRSALTEAFSNYGYRQNARLFFYYYGHGEVTGTDSDTIGPRTFLVPVDAPNPVTDEAHFYQVALPVTQVIEFAKEITAKHAFFALEACQAGSLVASLSGPTPPRPKGYLLSDTIQRPVRQFLTAGADQQDVLASSPFTPLLVEAINDADLNHDGYVTGSEVMESVIEKVAQFTTQNPEHGSIPNAAGDLVFGPVASDREHPKPLPPVATKEVTVTREWRSPELQVDCNHTNSGRIQAAVALDSNSKEKVIGVTAHYEGTDKIKDATRPTIEGPPGPAVVVNYGFNGLDRTLFGCPGGGHATVVVDFQISRTEQIQN
jgi:Caspase domain